MTENKQEIAQAGEAFEQNSQIKFYESLKAKAAKRSTGNDAGLGEQPRPSNFRQGPLVGGW